MGGGRDLPSSVGTSRREINVLITGYGPFPRGDGGQYTRNSSHEVTRLLPTHLSSTHPLNPTGTRVNIVNPTAPDGCYIPTEYGEIRRRTKQLHEDYARSVDLFIHLGQADGWHDVKVERMAFQERFSSSWWYGAETGYYMIKDNVGKTIDDLGPCPWVAVPVGLDTALDVDAVVTSANTSMQAGCAGSDPMAVVAHLEPGNYCCGFIYYESLANCFVQQRPRNVLFCHVPGELDAMNLARARDAVVAVIGSAAALVPR